MSTEPRWKHDGVRVIPGSSVDPTGVAQTPGMNRAAAINLARVGAQKLWAGTVHIHPNAKTGAHHHGPVESVIYVVRGKARMRWGDNLEFTAEAGAGAVRRSALLRQSPPNDVTHVVILPPSTGPVARRPR